MIPKKLHQLMGAYVRLKKAVAALSADEVSEELLDEADRIDIELERFTEQERQEAFAFYG